MVVVSEGAFQALKRLDQKNSDLASPNTRTEHLRRSQFFLISLCIHIAAFIIMGMVVLSSAPEPRESVSVQLMESLPQVRKLRRVVPMHQSRAAHHVDLPQTKEVSQPLVSHVSIPMQAGTEVMPVFEHEPEEARGPGMRPRIPLARKPLPAPEMTISKPVADSGPRESTFEIHEQFSRLSSPYSPASLPTGSTSDSTILRGFLRTVSRRIEESKRYPGWAMDAGLEGKVVVRFTILQDGTLSEEIRLVESSGAEILDNAAIAAIRHAAPFPSLPQALNQERLQIELPMDFRLTES
jgi:protein TonB